MEKQTSLIWYGSLMIKKGHIFPQWNSHTKVVASKINSPVFPVRFSKFAISNGFSKTRISLYPFYKWKTSWRRMLTRPREWHLFMIHWLSLFYAFIGFFPCQKRFRCKDKLYSFVEFMWKPIDVFLKVNFRQMCYISKYCE